jgi:superfamily II DNA or RNA helicase
MKLTMGNLYARVDGTRDELEWLEDYASYETRSFIPKARKYHVKRISMYDRVNRTLPAGLVPMIVKAAPDENFTVSVKDTRAKPAISQVDLGWLRDYQQDAVDRCLAEGRGIVWMPTGSGKCLGYGTPVLMFDGSIVPVEEVFRGEQLMGPDSKPRRVLSTTRGYGNLFRIIPVKGNPWVCNDAHVLTLVHTSTGEVTDVPLNEYLDWPRSRKHLWKLFSTGADFTPRSTALPIDPYFVGVWLGDGRRDLTQGVQVSKPDLEILNAVRVVADRWGLKVRVSRSNPCPTYRIVTEGRRNDLKRKLMELFPGGSHDERKIPHEYLTASRWERLELLAGLLDTDGHLHAGCFELVQKDTGIADGAAFLARSLGFRVTERVKSVPGYGQYRRLGILGEVSRIPTRIHRKKASPRKQRKNVTRTGFRVESCGQGSYYGFTLDGDGRFLLGDFTVTHNTECMVALVKAVRTPWLFVAHREGLMEQAAARYEKRTGYAAGRIGDGQWHEQRFTCATYQTLHAQRENPRTRALLKRVKGFIGDEAHTTPADTFMEVAMSTSNAYFRFGFSATPLARGDRRSLNTLAAFGPVIYRKKAGPLIKAGLLARPKIRMVPLHHDEGSFSTYAKAYKRLIVESSTRNLLLLRMLKTAKKPAMLFVKQLKHVRSLCAQARHLKMDVEIVDGSDKGPVRRSRLAALERGDLEAIICTSVFQEGIDVPCLRSVIVGTAGKSAIAAVQRLGRGMRALEGKDTFELWDIYDLGNKWMAKHARARERAYRKEGHDVQLLKE